jgi:3-hydroxymyristoyl/3-hydroxydecanoyl-(acyl carrier protein) dehydratase
MLGLRDVMRILEQRDPFLMLQSVERFEPEVGLEAIPRLPDYWTWIGAGMLPALMMEAMGQAAEVYWRLTGRTGKGYLVRVEGFELLQREPIPADEGLWVRMQPLQQAGAMCKALCVLEREEREVARVTMTHFFETE